MSVKQEECTVAEDLAMDVQALLQDIDSNYGENENVLLPPPYPRPNSHACHSRAERLLDPRQTPTSTYTQQAILATDASRIPLPYPSRAQVTHTDAGLELYDRASLAEPQSRGRTDWRAGSSLNISPPRPLGRVSLPGHTTPAVFSPTNPFEPRLGYRRSSVVAPSQKSKAQLSKYVHTRPTLTHASSSPSNAPQSSPSLAVTKRRKIQQPQPLVARNGKSSSSNTQDTIAFKAAQRPGPRISAQDSLSGEFSEYSSSSLCSPGHPQGQPQSVLDHAPPIVQGIQLISLNELPDRLRSVFRYPVFNAIQSKCFAAVYKSDDNLVVSAPTGGGKTAILELAICRLISGFNNGQYKIVYMAPTKSLCSERHRDWQAKFAAVDMQCAELTGDTDHGHMRSVQNASIIITTPEKWDSTTRKWKDHAKLMQLVKLFLIDEVHILKDTRGATLEAVVSRMKSVGTNVRFIALSATVPNSQDIATWLGRNPAGQHLPASQEKFGEELRPVKLQKHVVGLPFKGNDFAFESVCNLQLPSIITKYSHRKPIMVFCITRKTAMDTAKLLANVWASKGPRDRYWEGPTRRIVVQDPELKHTLTSGVAYHHAGLDIPDRHAVETGFLEGQINVICCTSTLAVGINLPCHMVVIKNTVSFQDDGIKEYADLEIMQMLGRAGRPQFDTTAVAVIITKQEKVTKYEKLISGEELLESCLHLNLIEHLNAEIGLGTIYDLHTAKRWLCGTFLYVRLGQNPAHYKLDGNAIGQNLDDRVELICKKDLALLEDTQLISSSNGKFKATELGDAMARYCVEFATMQGFMQLRPRARVSDILSAVVQAEEFCNVRLRAGEKKMYKEINKANGIRFPIKVDLAMHAHKRSLIVQSELGGVEFPTDEQYAKHKRQFNQDKAIIFESIHRLIRCIIDCQIHFQDAEAVRNALELARSFGARVWDNSPYQMKQISQIGLVAIRKLAVGGINSIETLEAAEPHRIEMLLSKNPPFGHKLLANLKEFPKPRVSVKMMAKESKKGRPVVIRIKAEVGFMNDKIPAFFHRKPVYICLLTERSDGSLVDFRRISANKLNNSPDIHLSAELLDHTQYITCYVMCDEVAGTMRRADLKPELPIHMFSSPPQRVRRQQQTGAKPSRSLEPNRVGAEETEFPFDTSPLTLQNDEFDDDGLEDEDMVGAVDGMQFRDIDTFSTGPYQAAKAVGDRKEANTEQTAWNPERLGNGRWACNHKCKNKTSCKHMCCREGLDKEPKAPKNSFVSAAFLVNRSSLTTTTAPTESTTRTERNANLGSSKTENRSQIEEIDLARASDKYTKENAPKGIMRLTQLHESSTKGSSTPAVARQRPTSGVERPKFSLRNRGPTSEYCSDNLSTDYDDDWMDELPSTAVLLGKQDMEQEATLRRKSIDYSSAWQNDQLASSVLLDQETSVDDTLHEASPREDHDLSQLNNDQVHLEDAMVGLSDSIVIHKASQAGAATAQSDGKFADLSECFTNHTATSQQVHVVEKESFLTDSPNGAVQPPLKRKVSSSFQDEDVSLSAPELKRSRRSNEGNQALQPSSKSGNQAKQAVPEIKREQPAWVYEFDPAFIAEWQDFVEFV